jgi:PKD repeat protein
MKHILLITLTVTACSACTKAVLHVLDAGADMSPSDATVVQTDAALSLAVDFTVEGCPSMDSQTPSCSGKVPLTLVFVPLATTTVTKFLWDFGDSTPIDLDTTPSHTYSAPGSYTVKVVAAGVSGGVVTKVHAQFVVVEPRGVGDPCTSDPQCDGSLFCLCAASAPCAAGLTLGMCTSSCQVRPCGDTQVCAGLLTALPPSGGAAPWQAALCLLECSTDADCAANLRCRTLPPGPTASAWVHGCFADVPGDVGDPCTDVAGSRRDDLCTTGFCAALGSKGMCSMDCTVASCPPGSDCAVLGDGRRLCLRPCIGTFNCLADPLLICAIPGPGALGYNLVNPTNPNSASTYCAPKPCVLDVSDKSCTPTGICAAESGNGHCVAQSN